MDGRMGGELEPGFSQTSSPRSTVLEESKREIGV